MYSPVFLSSKIFADKTDNEESKEKVSIILRLLIPFKYNKKDVRTLETIISDYFNPKNIFIKQVDREIDIK